MKKIYYLYLVIGIYCVVLLISGKMWLMIAYLTMLSVAKYYSIKRQKELNYMWHLAEKNKMSLSELSQLSNIGQLDLKATRYEESGRYLPPRKVVRQTINKLEKY